MADVTLVATDTSPSVFGTLTDDNGPLDLDGATVRFQMRQVTGGAFVVDAVATVVDAEAGEVRYDWEDDDLNQVPGDYVSRWRVTFDDGRRQHTSPANTIVLEAQ